MPIVIVEECRGAVFSFSRCSDSLEVDVGQFRETNKTGSRLLSVTFATSAFRILRGGGKRDVEKYEV
jgi:hypothetical protein